MQMYTHIFKIFLLIFIKLFKCNGLSSENAVSDVTVWINHGKVDLPDVPEFHPNRMWSPSILYVFILFPPSKLQP